MNNILEDLTKKRKRLEYAISASSSVDDPTGSDTANPSKVVNPDQPEIPEDPWITDFQNLRDRLVSKIREIRETGEHIDAVGQCLADIDKTWQTDIQTLLLDNKQLRTSIGEVRDQNSVIRMDIQELRGRNYDLERGNRLLRDENQVLRDENQKLREASRHLETLLTDLQVNLTASQAQVTRLQERRIHLCIGCYSEPLSWLARPCNHVMFCNSCYNSYRDHQRCPVCRTPIDTWEKVFLGMTN